jgi:hypothetical protein
MRERAELIGGNLEVWSQRQAVPFSGGHQSGTEVELKIPASVAYASSASRRSRLLSKMPLFTKTPFAKKTGPDS